MTKTKASQFYSRRHTILLSPATPPHYISPHARGYIGRLHPPRSDFKHQRTGQHPTPSRFARRCRMLQDCQRIRVSGRSARYCADRSAMVLFRVHVSTRTSLLPTYSQITNRSQPQFLPLPHLHAARIYSANYDHYHRGQSSMVHPRRPRSAPQHTMAESHRSRDLCPPPRHRRRHRLSSTILLLPTASRALV